MERRKAHTPRYQRRPDDEPGYQRTRAHRGTQRAYSTKRQPRPRKLLRPASKGPTEARYQKGPTPTQATAPARRTDPHKGPQAPANHRPRSPGASKPAQNPARYSTRGARTIGELPGALPPQAQNRRAARRATTRPEAGASAGRPTATTVGAYHPGRQEGTHGAGRPRADHKRSDLPPQATPTQTDPEAHTDSEKGPTNQGTQRTWETRKKPTPQVSTPPRIKAPSTQARAQGQAPASTAPEEHRPKGTPAGHEEHARRSTNPADHARRRQPAAQRAEERGARREEEQSENRIAYE